MAAVVDNGAGAAVVGSSEDPTTTTTTAPTKDFMQCLQTAWRDYEIEQKQQLANNGLMLSASSEFLLHHLVLDQKGLHFLADAMRHSAAPRPRRFCFQFCTFANDVTQDDMARVLLYPGSDDNCDNCDAATPPQQQQLVSFRFQGIFNGNFARTESIAPILKLLGGCNGSNLHKENRLEPRDGTTTTTACKSNNNSSTLKELQIGFTDLWSDPDDLEQYHQGCFYLKETLLNCPIESLDLFVCNLNIATVRALGEGMQGHKTLTKLCLNNCGLDNGMLQELVDYGLTKPNTVAARVATPPGCSLEHLELPRNDLTVHSLASLAKLLYAHPNLKFMDLSENALFRFAYGHNNHIVASFCRALQSHSSLQELVLRRVHLYNGSAKVLFEALEGDSSITTLYLEANPLQDGEWLNSLPSMKGLQNLSVEPYGGLSPRRAVETFGRNTKLQWLHLGGAPLNAYSMIRRNRFLRRVINDHRRNSALPLSVWPLAIASLGGKFGGGNKSSDKVVGTNFCDLDQVEPNGEALYEFVQNVLSEVYRPSLGLVVGAC